MLAHGSDEQAAVGLLVVSTSWFQVGLDSLGLGPSGPVARTVRVSSTGQQQVRLPLLIYLGRAVVLKDDRNVVTETVAVLTNSVL